MIALKGCWIGWSCELSLLRLLVQLIDQYLPGYWFKSNLKKQKSWVLLRQSVKARVGTVTLKTSAEVQPTVLYKPELHGTNLTYTSESSIWKKGNSLQPVMQETT